MLGFYWLGAVAEGAALGGIATLALCLMLGVALHRAGWSVPKYQRPRRRW